MGFPALAERSESTPTIGRRELHREDIAQLSIEVGAFRLGPLDHTNDNVPQRQQPLGDDAQRHRLAGTRLSRDQREPPLLDELLDAPGEMVDLGVHQQPMAGEIW